MTEKPILFSTEMVQAILSGRKTQTRRVIKEPCDYGCITGDCDHDVQDQCDNAILNASPYGKPGGKLWVRETWRSDNTGYAYKASSYDKGFLWKPSIHMPRRAARIILEVTDVRVERLQDISGKDAAAEGIQSVSKYGQDADVSDFADLWDSINKKRGYSWASNPYVWVVEFKRIDP